MNEAGDQGRTQLVGESSGKRAGLRRLTQSRRGEKAWGEQQAEEEHRFRVTQHERTTCS